MKRSWMRRIVRDIGLLNQHRGVCAQLKKGAIAIVKRCVRAQPPSESSDTRELHRTVREAFRGDLLEICKDGLREWIVENGGEGDLINERMANFGAEYQGEGTIEVPGLNLLGDVLDLPDLGPELFEDVEEFLPLPDLDPSAVEDIEAEYVELSEQGHDILNAMEIIYGMPSVDQGIVPTSDVNEMETDQSVVDKTMQPSTSRGDSRAVTTMIASSKVSVGSVRGSREVNERVTIGAMVNSS